MSLPGSTGFGIRVRKSGRKNYVVQTRLAGKLRWFTIGQHGNLTLEGARAAALEILALAKKDMGSKGLDTEPARHNYARAPSWLKEVATASRRTGNRMKIAITIFLIAMCPAVAAIAEAPRTSESREKPETPPTTPLPQPDNNNKTQSLSPGSKEWCEKYPDTPACKILKTK